MREGAVKCTYTVSVASCEKQQLLQLSTLTLLLILVFLTALRSMEDQGPVAVDNLPTMLKNPPPYHHTVCCLSIPAAPQAHYSIPATKKRGLGRRVYFKT